MKVFHYEPSKRACRIVEYEGLLFFDAHVCGEAAKREMSMYEQARALLKRHEEILGQYHSDKRHILRANIVIRSVDMLDEFNRAWEEWLADSPKEHPTRLTTTGLTVPECYKVVMSVIAARTDRQGPGGGKQDEYGTL